MKIYRKLLIYSVSFLACFGGGIALDLACGPETDPYDYYVSFFHNNVQGSKEYKPFYFTGWQFVYDDEEPQSEAEINSGEWAAYLGKEVNAADVQKAMYKLNPKTDSLLLDGYFKANEKLPDSLASNSFLRSVKRNSLALKYYRFAKEVEKIANTSYDRWDPKPMDTLALINAGKAALKTALLEKDKFIQLRYYYQAQRLLHYGHAYQDALKTHDKFIAYSSSKSHVKGWALALKAGELRHLKDTVQAAYLFSKVFAQYPERRLQAYRNYRYMHVSSTKALTHAANNSEKAVIYAINGFGDPALTIIPLEQVYQYEPTSPMVGVLLTREINKLEEKYLTRKLLSKNTRIGTNYYTDDDSTKDNDVLNYMNQLRGFCKVLVNQRKNPTYNLGNLAGAYINWIQGDNASGFAYLHAMDNETLSPAMNDQKQMIQLLLATQNIQRLNEVNEAQLLPALKWLDAKVKEEPLPAVDSVEVGDPFKDNRKFVNSARNFYEQVLAPAYLQQGDTVKAALAILKSPTEYSNLGFWYSNLHSNQVARLIRLKKTPPATSYLKFLTAKLNKVDINFLNELLGTAYLREHQYAKAIPAFKLVPADYLNKEPSDYYKGDPFVDKINDYPKVMRYGKNKGLNKLQFAEAMNELEQKIKSDAANAPSYFYRYATGLYNTSHYGNASYLIGAGFSANDFGRESIYSYDVDYIRTQNAKKYYLLARDLSNNEEFKAKCTFMAAKCRQKEYVMPNYKWPDYDKAEPLYMRQLHSNDYFDELRTKYKKTAFYKKAVGECSYLKDFVLTSGN